MTRRRLNELTEDDLTAIFDLEESRQPKTFFHPNCSCTRCHYTTFCIDNEGHVIDLDKKRAGSISPFAHALLQARIHREYVAFEIGVWARQLGHGFVRIITLGDVTYLFQSIM